MNTLHPDLQRLRADLRDAIETDLERRRSRRRARTRVMRIGVPGLTVVLGISLTFVLAGSQAAFAGWSASPTPASSGQMSTANAACLATLSDASHIAPGVASGSGWGQVATDVRGPFTLVIYQNGAGNATCLTGPSITLVSQHTANGRSVTVTRLANVPGDRSRTGAINSWSALDSGPSGRVNHMTLNHLDSTGQGAYTVVDGQIVEGVTGVTVVLSDGEHVQATTGNGWFVAWWPGHLDATGADITSAGGTSTQTLTPATPPMSPLPNGTGNSGGGA